MAHFTLYVLTGAWGLNPIKVGAFLEQLGLDYEVKTVDLGSTDKATGVKGEDFLRLCPNGRTPALIDHQQQDFVVWESGAILQYLAEVYDTEHKYHGKTPFERAIVNEWLFFQVTGHSPVQGNLNFAKYYWPKVFNEEAPVNVFKRFGNELYRVMGVYELQLSQQAAKYGEENAWLAANHLTIADFSALGWFVEYPKMPAPALDVGDFPHVQKYMHKLSSLPALAPIKKQIEQA